MNIRDGWAMVFCGISIGLYANADTRASTPQGPRMNPPTYEIVDLGDFGGELAAATAINDAGHVVGEAENLLTTKPFLWERGRLADIGQLNTQEAQGVANTISADGRVAGYSFAPYPPGGWTGHPFVWDRENGMVDLLPAGSMDVGAAVGINANGQVVGNLGRRGGFLWDAHDGMTFLTFPGALDGFVSTINALNESGLICGYQVVSSTTTAAWKYDSASGIYTRLKGLGGPTSVPFGLNIHGDVVGLSLRRNFQQRPVMWTNDGKLVDLGFLGVSGYTQGEAHAINDNRWIVGWDPYDGNGVSPTGWLWIGGLKVDLRERITNARQHADWTTLLPVGINNSGQIVGQGVRNGIPGRAFLMTPLPHAAPNRFSVDAHSGRS